MKLTDLLHPQSLANLVRLANELKTVNPSAFSGNHGVYTVPKGRFGASAIRQVWPDSVIIVCSPEEADKFYSPSEPVTTGKRIKFLDK